MIKMLHEIFATLTQSEDERRSNDEALAGLSTEDSPDEATAYAVLLTEIGRSDGEFTAAERAVVATTLARLFPNAHLDPLQLIKNAEGSLDSFRGSGIYIVKIKEEYSSEERRQLFEAIAATINADGITDSAEDFLKKKLARIL